MNLTAILCTARREPHFDWLADSIVHCLNKHPDVGFELIVIDKLLWGGYLPEFPYIWSGHCTETIDRRQQLLEAIRGRFSYRHLPPKNSPWQGPWRKTKRDFYALCNARNTGIALARGQHIILVDDCSVVDPGWLLGHMRGAMRRIAIAGAFRSYNKAKVKNGKIIEGELHTSGIDGRGEFPRLSPGGWLFGLNCSFPLEAALSINSYDEMYDGQGGSEDCCFGVRLERSGCRIAYLPDCLTYQILETHEPVCEFSGWGRPQPRLQKELMLRDGKMHFANEKLIQDLFDDPKRTWTRGNEYNLRELRERVLYEGYSAFPTTFKLEIDWRDMQPLSECE